MNNETAVAKPFVVKSRVTRKKINGKWHMSSPKFLVVSRVARRAKLRRAPRKEQT